jgi:outer membrane receptor for ferrienterochelin and colicin
MRTSKAAFVLFLFSSRLASPAAHAAPLSLQSAQSAVLSGTIRDQTGAALPGVTVELTAQRTPPRSTDTDASGRYRFDAVAATSLVNAELGYQLARKLRLRGDVFNLFDRAMSTSITISRRGCRASRSVASRTSIFTRVPRTVRVGLMSGF